MPADGTPQVVIEPEAFWCAAHLAPFRPSWPLGYLPATLWLLRKAVERDDIADAADHRATALSAVLREFGPICCLLGDDLVKEATERALSDDPAVVQKLIQEGAGK